MANDKNIELLDDMHLSSQSKFLEYYVVMNDNNISAADNILENNPDLANQIIESNNINDLINGVNENELTPKTDIDYYLDEQLEELQNMINNTKIMGSFDNSVQYYSHNFVYYQDKGYYAKETPPVGTLPTDSNYWIEYDVRGFQGYGGIDLNLRFDWISSADYKVGDVVVYKNRLWYAIADNTNFAPNINHYPWVVISLPQTPNKTPIQKNEPSTGYSEGDFWFKITEGSEVITNVWNIRNSELTPRFSSALFINDDDIYVVGGNKSDFTLSNANEAYNVTTGVWTAKADMPAPRTRFGVFKLDSLAYVVGGLLEDGTITNSVLTYDIKNDQWIASADDISLPISMITTAVENGDYGYVFGGLNENRDVVSSSYRFSKAGGWEAITSKPTPTVGHSLISVGNLVYAIGGINAQGEAVNKVEVYNTETNTWAEKANMITPRGYLATFYQSGNIYAVGGLDNNWYSLNVNERYNIETDAWEEDIPLTHERSSLVAVSSKETSYVIGGIDIGISEVKGYNESYSFASALSTFEFTVATLDNNKSFAASIDGGSSMNFYVDWGDGTQSGTITSGAKSLSHSYTETGEYKVRFIGTSPNVIKMNTPLLKSVEKCDTIFEDISGMFKNCSNLEAIPDNIFSTSTDVTSAKETFYGCSNLKIIPSGLFSNNVNITTFEGAFQASGLTSIPTNLFERNARAINFKNCFSNCQGLKAIPVGTFSAATNSTTFNSCFQNCTGITDIPANLFVNNKASKDFSYTFASCSGLSSIQEGLFKGLSNAQEFEGTFELCSNINSLPVGLFRDCSKATNYNTVFLQVPINALPDYTFNGNNASFDLPSGIHNVGNYAMNGLNVPTSYFKGNEDIEVVGKNIFSSTITDWTSMFENASNLKFIDVQDATSITNLTNTFKGCSNLVSFGGFLDENAPTLKIDFDISDCINLTRASILNIDNSLVVMTAETTKNLILSSNSLSLLTEAEKYVIKNKYWNLVGWTASDITSTLATEIVQAYKGETGVTHAEYIDETGLYYQVDLISDATGATLESYYVDKSTGFVYLVGEEPVQEYKITVNYDGGNEYTTYLSKGSDNDPNGEILKEQLPNLARKQTRIYIYNTSNLVSFEEVCTSLNWIKVIEIEDTSNVVSFKGAFANCDVLNSVSLTVKNATNLASMFEGCPELNTLDITGWDTSKVTDFSSMFSNSSYARVPTSITNISLENGEFDFSSATKVSEMFYGRRLLTPFGKEGTLGLAYPDTENYTDGYFDAMFFYLDMSYPELIEFTKMFAPIGENVAYVRDTGNRLVGNGGGENSVRLAVINNIYNNNWRNTNFKSFVNPNPATARPDSMIEEARQRAYDFAGLSSAGISYDNFQLATEETDYIVFYYNDSSTVAHYIYVDATIGYVQEDSWSNN